MIIKAQIKPRQQKSEKENQIRVHSPIPRDKRFLISINSLDESLSAYVYDLRENRIVYKTIVSNTKKIEEVYREIYRYYKKSDTRIVDPSSIRDVISELPSGNKKINLLEHTEKLRQEARQVPQVSRQESIHIRKIKDTYRYIDKYKLNFNVEVIKEKNKNSCIVYLYDEEQGVDRGTHRLEYNYDNNKYLYYYMEKLIMNTNDLENIFK